MDLDHFKLINDKYGHQVGDALLKEFADTVKKCLRLEDEFGRIGGEEFGLLLPHTSLSDAITVAERIRKTVEITPLKFKNNEIQITVSIGLSEANTKNLSLDVPLGTADKALYRAKKKGRNRVEVSRDYGTDENVALFGKS
jgi:diguanylate cyclase (GGDEF)-like protein